MNQSIEKLVVPCVEFQNDDTFLLILPFFMNNQAFNHLEIGFEGQNCSVFLSRLVFVLGQFQSLKVFDLTCDPDLSSNHALFYLIEALAGHVGLSNLILGNVKIGRNECAALSAILRNPASNLAALFLIICQIDDYGALILGGPAGEFPANIFEPGKISEKSFAVSRANNNNKQAEISGNKRTTD